MTLVLQRGNNQTGNLSLTDTYSTLVCEEGRSLSEIKSRWFLDNDLNYIRISVQSLKRISYGQVNANSQDRWYPPRPTPPRCPLQVLEESLVANHWHRPHACGVS